MTCPTDETLRQLLHGALGASPPEALEEHFVDCVACQRRLEDMAGPLSPVDRSAESPPLQQVMQGLSPAIDSSTRVPHPLTQPSLEAVARQLPFLSPSQYPGHLGRLGTFEVTEVLGQGGMGIVLGATDSRLLRRVAIKVLAAHPSLAPDLKERFLREARAVAAVKHDNIVTIHTVEESDGLPYFVMEYVAGVSLADRIKQHGALPWTEALRIARDTAAALVAAHARGIIHRDIKPGNILLEAPQDRVKLSDFGLAKTPTDVSLTSRGSLAGTPEYMSPEQAAGGDIDARSDLFSLGTVIYGMCTGRSPFSRSTVLQTLTDICQKDVPALSSIDGSIPPAFSQLVARLMEKGRDRRPGSAAELYEELRSMSTATAPASAMPGSGSEEARDVTRTTGRDQHPWTILAVVGLLAMVAVTWSYLGSGRDLPGPVPLPATVGPFTIAETGESLSDLGLAIAQATDGQTIEIHGDGPFSVESMNLGSRRLTLRAAAGSAPVFVPVEPPSRNVRPFLSSSADLQLDDLQIDWTMEPNVSGWDTADRSAISVEGGNLRVRGCRVAVGKKNCGLHVARGNGEVEQCVLFAPDGICLRWEALPGHALAVRDSLLQGAGGIASTLRVIDRPAESGELVVSHCSFVTKHALQWIIDRGYLSHVRVSMEHCLVESERLLTFNAPRFFPRLQRLQDDDNTRRFVQSLVDWREASNVYRQKITFIERKVLNRARRVGDPSTLDQWNVLWNLRDTGSAMAEFEVLYDESGNALQLDPVPSNTETLPEGVGADLQVLFPGRVQNPADGLR